MIFIRSDAVTEQFCEKTNKENSMFETKAPFSDQPWQFHDSSLNLNKKVCEQKIQSGQTITCSNYIPTSSIHNIQMYAYTSIYEIIIFQQEFIIFLAFYCRNLAGCTIEDQEY